MQKSLEIKKKLWEKIAETCVNNLKKHDFEAVFVQNKQQALDVIFEKVSDYKTYGFAGSYTTRKLGLPEKLKEQGKIVYDHWKPDSSYNEDLEIRKNQGRCDCFFCSANAISMNGEIINVDGVGNRTAAMSFGPQHVVIVAGMNKVTKDTDSALKRIREIAGPARAVSLGLETPCVKTGKCTDCNSEQRICRITTILHRRPSFTKMLVVLINDELGF